MLQFIFIQELFPGQLNSKLEYSELEYRNLLPPDWDSFQDEVFNPFLCHESPALVEPVGPSQNYVFKCIK